MIKNKSEKNSYFIPASIALLLYVIVQLAWSINLYKAYVEKEKLETSLLFDEVLSKYAFSSYGENLKNPVVGPGLNIERVSETEQDSALSYTTFQIDIDSHEQMTNLINDITILTGIIKDSLFLDIVENSLQNELSKSDILSFRLALYSDGDRIDYRRIEFEESYFLVSYQQEVSKEYKTKEQTYKLELETTSSLPTSLWLVFSLFILGTIVLIIVLFLLVRMSNDLRLERKSTHQQELFFYGLVHDLKLPLSLAHSLIDGLIYNVDMPNKSHSGLIEADNHILKLTDDINMLLTMHRLKQNKKSEYRQIYLYDVVQDIIIEIEAHYPEKEISFLIEFPNDLSIFFPAEELKLIMRVFLDNAVKFSQHAPKVTIQATNDGSTVSIKIGDNGSGIKSIKEYKSYELNQSRIRQICNESNGGIGLMVAWTIIKSKGGKITYNKIDPTGSLFTLSIPIEENKYEENNAH